MMTLTLSNTKTQFNITSPNLLESRYSLCRCAGWYERSVALLWLWWAKWTCVCLGTSGSEDYTDRPDPKKKHINLSNKHVWVQVRVFAVFVSTECRLQNTQQWQWRCLMLFIYWFSSPQLCVCMCVYHYRHVVVQLFFLLAQITPRWIDLIIERNGWFYWWPTLWQPQHYEYDYDDDNAACSFIQWRNTDQEQFR